MGLTQEEIRIMDQIAGTGYNSSNTNTTSISDSDFNNMSKIAEEMGYNLEEETKEPDLKTQIINEDPERAKRWQNKGEMSPYDLARSEAMSYYGIKGFDGTYDNIKAPRDPAEMNAMGKAVSAYLGEHLPYIKSGLKKLNNKLNSLVDTEAMINSQPRDYRAESWINMSNKIAVEMTPDKQEDLTKKIGFLDGLKGNIIEGTSLGALVNGIEDAQARSAVKKILNNEPIYQGELDALNLAVDRQKENIVRQYTPLGEVGRAVGYSMGFTLDLMLGSALFRTLGIGTQANALAQGITKSEKVGQIAEGITQAVVEPALTTLLNAPIRANKMYQERMLNQELAITKNGYTYLSEAEEKPATAFFKSLQQLYIEYFSEIVGGKILGAAMNTGGKVVSKAAAPIMNNVFKKYPALKTVLDKTTIAFAKKYEELNKMPIVGKSTGWVKNVAHFDGFLEECGEEALADVLNIVLGTNYEDRTLKNYAKAVFKTPEEWGVIAGAILLQGAGLSAASFVLGNNMAERNLPKEDIEEALMASEAEKEKLVEDLINSGELNVDIDTDDILKGGVTYNRYKNELIRQGADEQQADNSAQLIEQAYRVIADKFGNDGIEHLKNANLQVIMNNNNARQIQAEDEILDTIMSEEEKSDKLMQFSVDELKTDAKTFQYKGNSNSEGVLAENGLEGVEKWDNKVSGKVFVYENKKGERFIADGHQRLGLAKRLNDPNIKLDGYLFREADGFTPAQVRTLAAYKNIGEKSGTALDAAKIIKEVGLEKLPKTIPMNSTLFKDGVSLSRLGDVAFEKVVNEEIPMNYAARVADAIKTDEAKQAAAIDLIRKYYVEGKVPNAERAYNIASDINSAPTNVVEQINLFGTQEITELLYVEKAEIVDRAVKDLQTNKKLFLKASKNKGKLESKGKTKIDKAASEMTAREAAIAADIIQHRAYVVGDISTKANELAQKVKDGEIKMPEAVREFEDFVLTPKILKEITGYTRKAIKYNQAAIDKAANISDLLSEDEAGTITPLEFYKKGFYQGAAKDVTETAAFKNWFGNSKVVDEEGKPLVVYHGSVNTFEIFDKDRASAEGDMGAGFYFTDNEWDADDNYHDGGADFDNKIARRAEQIQQEREEEGEDLDYEEAKELAEKELRGEPHQFSVYLKMEKPCYVGENETWLMSDLYEDIDINEEDYETEDEYYEARLEAKDEVLQTLSYELDDALGGLLQYNDIERAKGILFEYAYDGVPLQQLKDRLNEEAFEDWDTGDFISNEVARKIVEALGYDGIIDSTPAQKFRGMNIPAETKHYIVFDSTQIKDTGNNGEFNPTNPNIYYQAAYHGTPHNFAKFSMDKIGTGEGAFVHGWGLYFAADKEVAEGYRNKLASDYYLYNGKNVGGAKLYNIKNIDKFGKQNWLKQLNDRLADLEKQKNEIETNLKGHLNYDGLIFTTNDDISSVKEDIKITEKINPSLIKQDGQILEVDIPENNVLLNEQKSIAKQYASVKKAIIKVMNEVGLERFTGVNALNQLTGGEVYDMISGKLDNNPKATSLLLNKYGIKGITYNGKEDGRCYVVFDDKAINILDRFYQEKENQEGEQAPRGQFRIDENGAAIIDILQNGDASTIVHELGHFYLYSVEQLAQKNKRAEKEFNAILEHYGFTAEDLKDYDKLTDLHEKFARGFEAYLLEGSAPTKKMLKVFKNFKLWLRDIYNSVKDLDVEFSEASQKLFDRIFTTDEEYEREVLPKYQYNYKKVLEIEQAKNEPEYKVKEAINNGKTFISTWYDKLFLPIDTRLGRLSPELKQKLRNHTAALAAITGKDLKTTTVFLNAVSEIKKQSPEDYYKLDLALKNRDSLTVNMVCEKYNLKKDFEAVRDILDDIYTEALEVGLDVGYLENYYPRQVKRDLTDKFIEYIEALERKEQLDIANQVLKLEDAKISLVLREMKEANNSQFWTQEDKAKFLNNRIRGFGQNNILLGRNGSLKYDRAIDELDGNFNQFYEPMEVSLVNYISSSRKTIEARKFFGGEDREVGKLRARIKRKKATLAEVQDRTPYQAKLKEENRIKYELSPLEIKLEALEKQDYIDNTEYKEKIKNKVERLKSQLDWTEKANPFQVKGVVIKRLKDEIYEAAKQIKDIIGDEENIEDSIGQLVAKLAQNGDIIAKDEREIRDMLVARFAAKSMSDPARILRDTTYIATLNDITNAITQFGDLAFSVYKFGFENTYKGIMKPFEIRKEDLGLNDLAYEFSNPSLLSKWIKKQFEFIGLSRIDGLGKNTYIQASILDAQKQIKKNNKVFDEKLKALFGDNIEEVKKDLLEGKTTDNTIIFTFNELADIQPISEDQTPELYNNGGSFMRLFYTLKTYGIKALDVARNDITMKIEEGIRTKNKKLAKEGLKNLVRLQMLLWLFGVPNDALKDLLSNRDFNLFETMIDNLIPAFLVNRYMFRTAGREGVGAAVVSFFSPACVNVIENTGKSYAISNIPLIGKPLYNWGIKEKK